MQYADHKTYYLHIEGKSLLPPLFGDYSDQVEKHPP